jgi:hypothetical protein
MTAPARILSLSVVGALSVGLTLGLVPAAHAATETLTDVANDQLRPGLDIIGVVVANGDYAVTVTMNFRTDRNGYAVVGLKARDRGLLRVVGRHDADGADRDFLLDADGRVRCAGLTSSWGAGTVTLTVPSTCLWRGSYGAVRAPWLLTEGQGHADVDVAGPTHWIARG